MSLKIFVTIAYGIIVLVGGFIGYSRAGSKKSLIAGARWNCFTIGGAPKL